MYNKVREYNEYMSTYSSTLMEGQRFPLEIPPWQPTV